MTLKAAFFDFDGLVLDTETADFEAWSRVYRDHGAELRFDDYAASIGTVGTWDPVAHLESVLGRKVDSAAADRAHRVIQDGIIERAPLLPGVMDRLDEARALGVRTAIASSSGDSWVRSHLPGRGLMDRFDAIVVRNAVLRAKPLPDIYEEALRVFGIGPEEAVAFEDSPNGIRSARAAGIYTVVVPTPLTARLDLSEADLRVGSLADITLGELGRLVAGRGVRA